MPKPPRFCPNSMGFAVGCSSPSFCLCTCSDEPLNERAEMTGAPWTHLNLICVILLCRKKFRDHNEITRLKMINGMGNVFYVSLGDLYLHKLNQFERKWKLHVSFVSWTNDEPILTQMCHNFDSLTRRIWHEVLTDALTPFHRLRGRHFTRRWASGRSLFRAIRHRIGQKLIFPICLNHKWVAKLSDKMKVRHSCGVIAERHTH